MNHLVLVAGHSSSAREGCSPSPTFYPGRSDHCHGVAYTGLPEATSQGLQPQIQGDNIGQFLTQWRHILGLKVIIFHYSPSPHSEGSFLFGDLIPVIQVSALTCIPLRLRCVPTWTTFSPQECQMFCSILHFKQILIVCEISF